MGERKEELLCKQYASRIADSLRQWRLRSMYHVCASCFSFPFIFFSFFFTSTVFSPLHLSSTSKKKSNNLPGFFIGVWQRYFRLLIMNPAKQVADVFFYDVPFLFPFFSSFFLPRRVRRTFTLVPSFFCVSYCKNIQFCLSVEKKKKKKRWSGIQRDRLFYVNKNDV